MKNMVLLRRTSVEKDSSNCPFSLFSHIFLGGALSFFEPLSIIIFGPSLFLLAFPHMGQCSNNDDHHTFIDLQLDTRTKYDYMNASSGVPGYAMNQE